VSNFSISGISSGLDTRSLVDGLMAVERQAVRRLEASQTRANDQIRAWNLISTRLGGAKTAIETLRTGGLGATTASTSNQNAVRASPRSDALTGTYQFRVTQLANAQQVSSAGISSGRELTGAGVARVTSGMEQRNITIVSDSFADGSHVIDLVARDGAELTVRVNGERQTVTIGGDGRFTLDDGDGGTLELDAGAAVGGGGPLTLGTLRMTRVTADETTTVLTLASQLNAAGGPVRAQVVDTGDGSAASHRLVLSARSTGVANAADIDLSGLALFNGGLTTIRNASDAVLTMGDGAITITRPTNSITDAIPGVTLDLVGTSPDTDVEVTVGADLGARVANVKTFVDEVNRALSQVQTATRYNVETNTGAPLVGNSAARGIGDRLTAAMGAAVPGGSLAVLGQIGITLSADGTYRLDETRLRAALESNPEGVQRLLVGDPGNDSDGLVDRVHSVLQDMTRPDSRIGTAVKGAEATIRDLRTSIATQERRLEITEQRYLRQFAAMESALSQLQSQSGFLASALGGGGLGRSGR
jgi:flagellar hook-associated protein 2